MNVSQYNFNTAIYCISLLSKYIRSIRFINTIEWERVKPNSYNLEELLFAVNYDIVEYNLIEKHYIEK